MPSSIEPDLIPLETWAANVYHHMRYAGRGESATLYGSPRTRYYVPADLPMPDLPAEVTTARQCGECGEYRRESDFTQRQPSTCGACRAEARRAARELVTRGRRFGVELEFSASTTQTDRWGYEYEDRMDPDTIVDALRTAGLHVRNEGYSHRVYQDEWKLVSDSSLNCGWELVSPPMHWDQRDQIMTACRVLSDLGCEATDDCGLHVHHEVRDFSLDQIKSLILDWNARQDVTDRLVAPHRHSNYCQWAARYNRHELNDLDMVQDRDAFDSYIGRYHSLNPTCLGNYGTVEIRQHQSTLDGAAIVAWVAYGQAFLAASKDGTLPMIPDNPTTPECEGLIDSLPITCAASKARLKELAQHPAENIPARARW